MAWPDKACVTALIQRTAGVQDCIRCSAGGVEWRGGRGDWTFKGSLCWSIASLALEAALRNFRKTRPGHWTAGWHWEWLDTPQPEIRRNNRETRPLSLYLLVYLYNTNILPGPIPPSYSPLLPSSWLKVRFPLSSYPVRFLPICPFEPEMYTMEPTCEYLSNVRLSLWDDYWVC